MSAIKFTPISPALFEYLELNTLLPHPVLTKIAEETAKLPDSMMQIPRHQGGFMYLLCKMLGARNVIELGCYTGYSAICLAAALPTGGRVTTFDIDPKTSEIARKYFLEAGFKDKIEIILGEAVKTLPAFLSEFPPSHFDLAFIDADKINYEAYFEMCLGAVRPGGLILVDNAFRDGEILAPAPRDLPTQAVHRLTHRIKMDTGLEAVTIPVADGLIVVRKP
jgi:predicted O-methyltransferase YrrM